MWEMEEWTDDREGRKGEGDRRMPTLGWEDGWIYWWEQMEERRGDGFC